MFSINTSSSNCIISDEAYNALVSLNNNYSLGINNAIMVDGGGSYVLDYNGTNVAVTTGNRRINNLGLY